jgi:hypothetical protein
MSKACLTCAQDPKNPCYGILIEFTTPIGSVITETDTVKILTEPTVSSTGLVEVVPYISQNSSGGYYYKFSIIIDREVKNFVIYKSNSFWTVAQQDSPNSVTYTTYSTTPVTNISLECIFEDITESAIWTNVQADNVIPNLNISSVKRAILVTPSNNTTSCEPPIDVPIDVTGSTINAKITTLYKCIDYKGTDYLNKLKSGIACSNIELIKLSLILDLLKQKDCDAVLPCIYAPTSETYLQTFLKYIGKQCSECLNRVALKNNYSNFDIVDRVPAASSPKVVSPNGTPITFENGLDLTL